MTGGNERGRAGDDRRRLRLPAQHRAFIQACLAPPDDLIAALDECFADAEPRDVDHAAQQLFGHLYRRLDTEGLDHRTRPSLHRAYMHTWHNTQRLLFNARPLFARIEELTGRPPLVLKGGAMASSAYYDDLGVRPVMDLDVFVERSRVPALVDWATADGWMVSKGLDTSDIFIVHHAIDLENGSGGAVDIHWALLVQSRDNDGDRRLADGAVDARLGDVDVRILRPTDQLFHTAAHAKPEGIRHLVDVATIVRRHADTIDWSALVDEVIGRRTITYAEQTLSQAEEAMPGTVPPAALARLRAAPRHWSDTAYHGQPMTTRREAIRRLAADVSTRARGEPPAQRVRVARAMVRRYAQAQEMSGRDVLVTLVTRGPGELADGMPQ